MSEEFKLNDGECNEEIYKHGSIIAVLDATPIMANAIVMEVKKSKGFVVDWHYVGGRAYFKSLDNSKIEDVKNAILVSIPTSLR